MMFAFSRDGAVPGNGLWRRVSKHRVPVYAVFAIGILSGLLMVPAIWNYLVGYAAGTAIAVIGLYIAFAIPVYLRLRHGDKFEHGAWSLGRHYKWLGWVSIVWVAFITVLFSLPMYKDGLPWSANFYWTLTNYTVSGSQASASWSAAGGSCRLANGSRARCGWAPRKSSSSWRRSRRASSCSPPTPATRLRVLCEGRSPERRGSGPRGLLDRDSTTP